MEQDKKKILFISDTPTHPVRRGNQQAIMAYADMINKLGFEVYFFLICEHFLRKEEIQETQKYWGNKFYSFKQPFILSLIQRALKKIHKIHQKYIEKYNYKIDIEYLWGLNNALRIIQKENNFDYVLVNYIWNTKAFYVFPYAKKILFTHDLFSNRYQRTGSHNFFTTSPNEEMKALNRSDAIFSIQENESIFFRYLTKKEVYTTFLPLKIQETSFCGNRNILFLASENQFNVDSLQKFIQNVLPKLRIDMPDACLIIGGNICNILEQSIIEKGCQLIGPVDNLYDFYSRGDIVINPVSQGTGLKIKSIQALEFTKVLISDPHCVEGMYNLDSVPISVACSSEDYVKIISDFFTYPEKIKDRKKQIIDYINDYLVYIEEEFKKGLNLPNKGSEI